MRMANPRTDVRAGGRCQREIAGNAKPELGPGASKRNDLDGVVEDRDPLNHGGQQPVTPQLGEKLVSAHIAA